MTKEKKAYTLNFADFMVARYYQLPPKEGLPMHILESIYHEYEDTCETAHVFAQCPEVVRAIYGEQER